MKKPLFFLSVIFFLFSSCSKENGVKTKTELLTQKSWKFEMYGLDENNDGIIQASENNMQSCELDDHYRFYPNGTGVYEGGSQPCSVDEPATIDFNWSFENGETELAVFGAPEKINKIDENYLEVFYLDQNTQGETVKYIRRFQH